MSESSVEPWVALLSEVPLAALLPVVRDAPPVGAPGYGSARDVLAIHADRLIIARLRRRRPLPARLFEPGSTEGWRELPHLTAHAELPLDQVVRVQIAGPLIYGNRWLLERERGYHLRLSATDGRCFELLLPEDDAQAVLIVLRGLLADRFEPVATLPALAAEARPLLPAPRARLVPWLLRVTLVAAPLFAISIIWDKARIAPWIGVPSILALVGAFCVSLVLLARALGQRRRGLAEKERVAARRARRRARERPTGREPLRSERLGRWLKAAGAVAFLAAFLIALLIPQWMPIHHFDSILQALAYVPATLLIYYGYRLGLRSASDVRHDDTRPPILYLRSFGLDERNNLNPSGFIAQSLGLEPPWLLRWLGPVGNIYPVRLVRLLFSRSADHAEEQIATFFQRFGPFVAIGRPGDRLAIGGAARVYLEDTDWRAAVTQLIDEAGGVVIQPDDTEQMWWEIREAFRRSRPENILFLLLSCAGAQWKYERFRLRFERETGRTLPRALGDGVFLHFTPAGPQLLPVRHLPHVAWPIAGCAVDFPRTLAPFLAAREARSEPIAPAPPRWLRRASAGFGLAVWIWIIGLVYFAAAVPLMTVRMKLEARSMARVAASGAGATVAQGPVETPYQLTLPGDWRPQEIELPLLARVMGTGKFLRCWTAGELAVCLVMVEQAGEGVVKTSSEYRDRIVADLRRKARSVEILSEAPESADGREWLTTRLRVRGGGGFFTEPGLSKGLFFLRDFDQRLTLRTYVGPHGFMQIQTGAATPVAPILEPALTAIFRSFHYESPAQMAERTRRELLTQVLAEPRRETYSGRVAGFNYRVALPPPWRRADPDSYQLGDDLLMVILAVGPATSAPAGKTPLRTLQDDLMVRVRRALSDVLDLREAEVQHDGRNWIEAQFDIPGQGKPPLFRQWLTMAPEGGLLVRFMVKRSAATELRPLVEQAFAGVRIASLRDQETERAAPLVPGFRQQKLRGRVLPYTLTLDTKWAQDPPGAPFDLACHLGSEVAGGVIVEDLRRVAPAPTAASYATAVLDQLRRRLGPSFAIEQRGSVSSAGLPVERVRFRRIVDQVRLHYTMGIAVHRGYGFQILCWSGFETPEVHDSLAEPMLRGFKPPP